MVELNGELHLPTDLKSVLQAPPQSQASTNLNKKGNNEVQQDSPEENGGRKRKIAYLELGSIHHDKEVCIYSIFLI